MLIILIYCDLPWGLQVVASDMSRPGSSAFLFRAHGVVGSTRLLLWDAAGHPASHVDHGASFRDSQVVFHSSPTYFLPTYLPTRLISLKGNEKSLQNTTVSPQVSGLTIANHHAATQDQVLLQVLLSGVRNAPEAYGR